MIQILVYETDKEAVRRLVFLLSRSGYSCTVASSSQEVIYWLSAELYLSNKFDLLVIGSNINDGDFLQLSSQLNRFEPVPVIHFLSVPGRSSISLQGDDLPDSLKQLLARYSSETNTQKEEMFDG